MAYQNITLETKDGVARLTINRPPANVMNYETLVEMNAALEAVAKDPAAKVLLVRGSGNRAFSAGVEVKDHMGDRMPVTLREFGKVFKALHTLGKPSIAVVNGVALGGGCELAAGCDMVIASDKAQFGQPEIKLGGLAPVAAALLPAIVGVKKAFEIVLLGENFSAAEAERIGLVSKVVPDAELDKAADAIAAKFLQMTALGLKLSRDAFYRAVDTAATEQALFVATEAGIKTWETTDSQEGLKAFLEKRSPVWKNQ